MGPGFRRGSNSPSGEPDPAPRSNGKNVETASVPCHLPVKRGWRQTREGILGGRMWLKTAIIKNFRGIENLSIQFEKRADVIVGPNAIGKTTLLEAIRLTKAALAPRIAEETQQVFMSLGAILPQNPTRFNYAALARDINRAIEIDTVFSLTQDEGQSLDGLIPQLATTMVRAGMGRQPCRARWRWCNFSLHPWGSKRLPQRRNKSVLPYQA
jgi:hypothetical protein